MLGSSSRGRLLALRRCPEFWVFDLESVVGLEGGLDDELKGVLLRRWSGPVGRQHLSIPSTTQIDAADRMARAVAKHPRRPRFLMVLVFPIGGGVGVILDRAQREL